LSGPRGPRSTSKGAFVPGGWYGQPCYTQSTTSTTSTKVILVHQRAAAAPPQALLRRHSKIAAVVRGEWSPQPRVTQSHSIFNSNKQYILVHQQYIHLNSNKQHIHRNSVRIPINNTYIHSHSNLPSQRRLVNTCGRRRREFDPSPRCWWGGAVRQFSPVDTCCVIHMLVY